MSKGKHSRKKNAQIMGGSRKVKDGHSEFKILPLWEWKDLRMEGLDLEWYIQCSKYGAAMPWSGQYGPRAYKGWCMKVASSVCIRRRPTFILELKSILPSTYAQRTS